ncbi:AfsR/SARP family transcriptional regulator [Amycolatopsis cihanbeyliensis]|nr:BTAD domain-containing putative transcriptional regulator [Amycolatopsis cihanbeyliensis]
MLGPLEAWHEGSQIPLGDQQQRFVLVVLLLHANRPVSTVRLTEIVWGSNPARRDLVRGYINKLRNAFQDVGNVRIETMPTGYLLRVGAEQLDTARFDRLRAEAEVARTEDPHRAVELLRAAVGLWRGRFLEDVDIDRVGGPEVISPDDSHLDAVGDLAELEVETGDHRSARNRLRPVVRADPASQRHAEILMRSLLADGDRVAVVRVFHGTRDALAELGVEPGLVLRSLAARAERGEPTDSLPFQADAFTGRNAITQLLVELGVLDVNPISTGARDTHMTNPSWRWQAHGNV